MYYWAPDHYLKWQCQAFQDDFNTNWIQFGDNQKVCLKSYIPGAWHGFIRQRKSRHESVVDAEKLYYPSLLPANVQTLGIEDADLDPNSSDDKVKYISLDKPIKIGVLAAQSN